MEIISFLLNIFVTIFKSLASSSFFWIMLILTAIVELTYPKYRGYMGEFWVRQELKKLPKDKYKVLYNIMLEKNNITHQIDHLIVSKYGIFVIEMKNYYGNIYGDEYKDNWIQYLGKKKFYFRNPIHQNYGHLKTLQEILNIDINKLISIVCFSNQCKLKIKSSSNVVYLDYLVNTIKKYNREIIDDDLDELVYKINALNITNKLVRREHVKNIRAKINDNKEKANNMICPKCGHPLVARNGKYGPFIGCSNYPNCRYINKIK